MACSDDPLGPLPHPGAQPPQPPPFPVDPDELLARTAPPRGVHAVAVVGADGVTEIRTTGGDPPAELFEVGSLTKTFTATALAVLVVEGTVALDDTLGVLLGPAAGAASTVTLGQLATHTSGLPRLAPGAMRPPFWPRDPYRFFGRRRLMRSLRRLSPLQPGPFAYSNVGFALLARALEAATATPFRDLLAERVFAPAGMATARCQPCPRTGLVHGEGHWLAAGRWHQPNPGGGGVDASIVDLAAWARVNLLPDDSPLAPAVRLAHRTHHDGPPEVGLAWVVDDDLRWHNGATGRFQSIVAVGPDVAVAAAAAYGPLGGDHDLTDRVLEVLRPPPSPP